MAETVLGNKVLDIGYASMPNPYISKFYCVGYDRLKPTHSKSNYDEEIQGDVKDIQKKLRNRKFDTIICGELIEHLENPCKFLRDIHALLTDEGRLILSTPNPLGFPVVLFEIFRNKKYFYSKSHTYYFLPRWIERLLDLSGYELCKIKPVGFWLPLLTIPYSPIALSYQLIYVACKRK